MGVPNYPVQYDIIPLADSRRVVCVDKEGTVYVVKNQDTVLEKTSDWGETFDQLYDFETVTYQVAVVSDGSLIATTGSRKLLRSEDGGASWSEVLSMNGRASKWGGLDVYDRFVVFAPYHEEKAIYLSTDYGKTFNKILEIQSATHCHTVKFDPYENIIWSSWGDHRPNDTLLFTDDLGATWQTLADKHYMRVTNIMPLPTSVWFGSDEIQIMGAYKHDRPVFGTSQTPVKPFLAWAAKKATLEDNAYTWATKPAIVYGSKAMAYWGYTQKLGGGIMPPAIYACDGERVYPLMCLDKRPDAPESNGICGVWGPTTANILVADLRSVYDGTSQHLLKVQL